MCFIKGSATFFNFYGQPEARLNGNVSVYGHWTNRRTWFIKSISIFLFSVPDVHLENLQKMWVDGMLHKAFWEEGLRRVTDEWQGFIILYVSNKTRTTACLKSYFFTFLTFKSSLVLNANVAFLSIQSVDTYSDSYRSPAQISSYCSITASIGSIILGLILVRQSRTKYRETACELVSD